MSASKNEQGVGIRRKRDLFQSPHLPSAALFDRQGAAVFNCDLHPQGPNLVWPGLIGPASIVEKR